MARAKMSGGSMPTSSLDRLSTRVLLMICRDWGVLKKRWNQYSRGLPVSVSQGLPEMPFFKE